MNEKLALRSLAVAQEKEEKVALATCEKDLETAKLAQQHLQTIAQQLQQHSHRHITKVVSRCLSAVFDERIELRIEFERKRGRTEARFTYLKNGYRVNPKVSSGGVMDVAALALRLAALTLTLPPARKLLILDEPFRSISVRRLNRMGQLIESLSKDLRLQIIIASHDEELQIGKVVRL